MTAYELALSTMDSPASVSVRLNPFKVPEGNLPILEGAVPVPWNEFGYILKERPVFTLHPLFHAGVYYVQDSSAMYVGHIFRKLLGQGRGVKVLDLCAAPGGKTTDLAASLRLKYGDDFLLVSNEVMKQRAGILKDNVCIWGDPNVVVTSVDPAAFAAFGSFFDIVVADVPCSGEGMFRKDDRAFEEWSEDVVELCSQRQRRIIADVWPSLKEGGLLIYSTCTFEEAENDDNLEWAARELGGEIIPPENEFEGVELTRCGSLLVPGRVPGEGQWVGALRKTSEAAFGETDLSALRPLLMGVNKGETKGKDFVPSSDWALSLDFEKDSYPWAEVDKLTALHFLHRDTICLPEMEKGYNVVAYKGIPLGFVKNLGTRCNNLHPMGRRIRMNIDDNIKI